jgi:hypothetical protein
MKQNSLSKNGLSLSQAQSISNLCNQRAMEISAKFDGVNNYSKTVNHPDPETTILLVRGNDLPVDVIELLKEKSQLHACQAFLMENIRAKNTKLEKAKYAICDISKIERPDVPKFLKEKYLEEVDVEWGWEQLTSSEMNEFIEAEAYAAHIGQFIHKGGTLDNLRKELPKIAPVEWMVIKEGEKTPVFVTTHHTSEQLMEVHEELATLHRQYEQRVNYFKAKVKNLVTEENARIARCNSVAQAEISRTNNDLQAYYESIMLKYNDEVKETQLGFEQDRQELIKTTAAQRIEVDARFQPVVDMFLSKMIEE